MARMKKIDLQLDDVIENRTVDGNDVTEEPVTETTPPTDNTIDAELVDISIPTPTSMPVVEGPVMSTDVRHPPICDLQGLSEEEMYLLISNRIKTIISKSRVPYIPALLTYRESDSTSAPPISAIVDKVDHVYLMEAWDYYKGNARNPNVPQFLEMVRNITKDPERVFVRIVPISLL